MSLFWQSLTTIKHGEARRIFFFLKGRKELADVVHIDIGFAVKEGGLAAGLLGELLILKFRSLMVTVKGSIAENKGYCGRALDYFRR